MLAYIARRLLQTIPVMLIVAIVVFLALRIGPNDPAAIIAGDNADGEQVARIRQQLGLDQPLLKQMFVWFAAIARGDFGESFFFKKPVSALILDRLEPTIALTACTMAMSILIAAPMGALAAMTRGRLLDRLTMGLSALGFSVPVFVIGYVLIYIFAIRLGWFPVQGYQRLADGLPGFFRSIALPSATLAFVYVALIARVTRASLLEVLGEDYIRTAYARGLTPMQVLIRHALPNAAAPIITVIGLGIALLIGGVVVTESVFSIPGLGRLTVDAVLARDFPTIQAVILLFSFMYVLVNLLIDIAYTIFDPRIRY